MTQRQNVVCQLAHGPAVVDPDPRRPWDIGGLVDDHHRELPLQHELQIGILVRGGVDHESIPPADNTAPEPRPPGGPTGGHQQQALADLFAGLGQAGGKVQRRRSLNE